MAPARRRRSRCSKASVRPIPAVLEVLGIDAARQPGRPQAADRGHAPDGRPLPEADRGRGPRPVPQLLQALTADRAADRLPRPGRTTDGPDPAAVRWPAPAPGRRPGAGQRPRGDLPRRAHDRPRPGRSALAVGPRPAPPVEGKTILLTTHYMEEAEVLCDRLAIMDHGTDPGPGHRQRAGCGQVQGSLGPLRSRSTP